MPTADSPAPRLLFRTAFPLPVWRLWPAPGLLAVELRDAAARTVSFVVLAAADGRELRRYHDPATPWWLTLAGVTADGELLLAELDPARLGQPIGQRRVGLPGVELSDLLEPAALPSAWLRPEQYPATNPHFAPLARFIEALIGVRPAARIELLEMPAGTLLGFERAETRGASGASAALYELLLVGSDRALLLRAPLGGAPVGPDDARFCTFGPILYACGAPGEVFAWALPPVRPLP